MSIYGPDMLNLEGYHRYMEAVLDTENLTLSYENTLDIDGFYEERRVIEAVILLDGTRLFQCFYVRDSGYTAESYAVFKRASGDTYSAVVAEMDPDFGFSYSSIIGKGDMTTTQMARDYSVTHVFTVENDEMSYQKK